MERRQLLGSQPQVSKMVTVCVCLLELGLEVQNFTSLRQRYWSTSRTIVGKVVVLFCDESHHRVGNSGDNLTLADTTVSQQLKSSWKMLTERRLRWLEYNSLQRYARCNHDVPCGWWVRAPASLIVFVVLLKTSTILQLVYFHSLSSNQKYVPSPLKTA